MLPTTYSGLRPIDFESNSWVLDFPAEGDLIEGAVAAYYLDISDPTNAPEGDAQALGHRFVADILSGCTHVIGAPFAISEIRNCFENNLSPIGYQLSPAVPFPAGWTLNAALATTNRGDPIADSVRVDLGLPP